MEQILEQLFESVPKARILRLLLRNPEERFRFDDIVKRSQTRPEQARKELRKLLKISTVKEGLVQDAPPAGAGKQRRPRKIRVYFANPAFPCFAELRDLIARSSVAPRHKIFRRIKGLGKIKLAVISGLFIQSDSSRTDLLIVGDHIHKRKMDRFLADTESELGKQIRHTVMDTEEFLYRMDMYDRFLRDILEYPHEKLINKFNF